MTPVPDATFDMRELADFAHELRAMRDAIVATRREVTELQSSPLGATGMHRATSELDAVSLSTELAASTILSAVEEIENAANLLRATGVTMGRNDPVAQILDRVLTLYEACNFQDIAGQRIRKVTTTLQFVEERLDRVVSAWSHSPLPLVEHYLAGLGGPLAGPSLPGDAGRVSQTDVDALFSGGADPPSPGT